MMSSEFAVYTGSSQPHWLHCWAISGIESCITVRSPNGGCYSFDMGQCTKASMDSDEVFITHGHVDHCGDIAKHISQRHLRGKSPAVYYCPQRIVEPLTKICEIFDELNDHGEKGAGSAEIVGVAIGEEVTLRRHSVMRPFRTYHRVPSQGYLIYCKERFLKAEFLHLKGPAIHDHISRGIIIHETKMVPEIAYTGDTTFDTFLDEENKDVLMSKILITETTYIDDRQPAEKARDRGHMHLQDIATNAELFRNVKALVLVHLSDRYNANQAAYWVKRTLPNWLCQKTWIPTLMKDLE